MIELSLSSYEQSRCGICHWKTPKTPRLNSAKISICLNSWSWFPSVAACRLAHFPRCSDRTMSRLPQGCHFSILLYVSYWSLFGSYFGKNSSQPLYQAVYSSNNHIPWSTNPAQWYGIFFRFLRLNTAFCIAIAKFTTLVPFSLPLPSSEFWWSLGKNSL